MILGNEIKTIFLQFMEKCVPLNIEVFEHDGNENDRVESKEGISEIL